MSERENHGPTRKNPEFDALDRREFLTAATGLASAALLAGDGMTQPASATVTPAGASPLAIDGGPPVRATMLEAKLSGPQYYDDEEKRELIDVLENRSPFTGAVGSNPTTSFRTHEET